MPIVLHTWNAGDVLNHADLNSNFSQLLAGVTGSLSTAGGTMGGPIVLPGDPTQPLQAATKNYVDAVTGASLPPIGGSPLYMLRVNSGTTGYELRSPAQVLGDIGGAPLASPTFTGTVTIPAGLMTGALTLAADPTSALQPATKQYADTRAGYNLGRNRLHNGWCSITQRGQTNVTTTGGYVIDRWQAFASGAISAFPGVMTGYGPSPSPQWVIKSSQAVNANDSVTFAQKIESWDAYDLRGQSVTVSFYAAASTTAGSVQGAIFLQYPATGADGWGSTITTIGSSNVPLTSTPTRLSATFTNLPNGVQNGLLAGFQCQQLGSAGTLTYNATCFQLEPGSILTPFEHRPYPLELMLCQRFYETTYSGLAPGSTATDPAIVYVGLSGTTADFSWPFKVPKRVVPTVTVYNPYTGTSGQFALDYSSSSAANFNTAAGQNYIRWAAASALAANHYICGHFAASADL